MELYNSKHLSDVSKISMDKKGWLFKRGSWNSTFRKRWFCLKNNILYYFKDEKSQTPIGVIILDGYTVEEAMESDVNSYSFLITFPGSSTRNYVFAAESLKTMNEWISAIRRADMSVLKHTVEELRKRLDKEKSLKKT